MKNFEIDVIDPILTIIKKNQVYLTEKENLPQLAKLGYMYNSLWYGGRMCWGSSGIIEKHPDYVCEDNPKYKIDMCEPETTEIEDLIYDAWGMHVSDKQPSWEEFKNTVYGVKEYTETDEKDRKVDKTFEEWVEVLTNPEYEYAMSSRKKVANHLLCVIGNGFGYKNGFIIREASGADQDQAIYGKWEIAKFREDIQEEIDNLMKLPEVEQTVQKAHEYIAKIYKERDAKEDEQWIEMTGLTYKEYKKTPAYQELLKSGQQEKYHAYYPISEKFSEITKFDANTHPSYIKAGLEICEEILQHIDEERPENVKFAKKYINKFSTN